MALSQQLFAGFPQIVLITIVWVFLLFFNKSLFTNNRLKLPLFFYLIFFVALGFLTASIQLIPQYEFLKISTRSKISETQASYYSYPFKHLVTLVLPYFLGNPKSGTYPPFYEFDGSVFWENTGYLGLIGIFFATLGLFSKFAYKKILLTSTLLSFLLMTGKFSPLYFVYEIPPFSFFRVPSRFILPFVFSLAILAGFFFQNLTSFFARIKIRNKLPLLTFISLLVIFLQFLDLKNFAWSYHAVAPWKDWLRKPATVEFINSQDGQKSSPKIISLFTSQPWNDVFTSKGWKSTEPYYYFRNDLMPNYNTLFNIKQFGVYPVQKTKRFDYFESLLLLGVKNDEKQIFISTTSAKLLGTAGVNYLIAPKYIITTENNQPIYKTTSKQNLPSYNVYSLKPTYSVYFTDSYLSASTLDEALNLLSSGKFNPPQNVILEKDFKLTQDNENHRPASISLIKTTNIDSTYDVKTDREGFLVLAQSFYPGWQVFVDGEVKEILPANLNFTAVFLTKGNHRVSFIYKPVSLRISLIFSLAGLVISFLMVLVVPLIYLRKSANNRSFSSRY
ncbi:MAG: YfhO family protein [Patescibacteria group bacterium]|nr:YfhO family protein [Patescibacteria group bacterium]